MLTVKERIQQIVHEYYHSQKELCQQLGVTQQAMAKWFMNDAIPTQKVILLHLHHPTLSIEWLTNGQGDMHEQPTPQEYKLLPYYEDVQVACGVVAFMEQDEHRTMVPVPPGTNAKFLLKASGESMRPRINPGDLIGMQDWNPFESFRRDQPYLIITRDAHCMVKYITDPGAESPFLLLSTENPDYYMSDADRHLSKDSVLRIFKVTFIGGVREQGS